MKNIPNFHGSDIEKISQYYGISKDRIHNFSGNVNPLGLSKNLASKLIANIHLVTQYPDPDYLELKANIASYTSSKPEYVLLGNGTTELIAHYIDYVKPKKVLIVGPTYSEYEKKSKTIQASVVYYPLKSENDFKIDIDALIHEITKDIDLLVLCNPNNPTATLTPSSAFYPIFDHCKSNNTFVLVDETYMDFVSNSQELSSIPLVESYSNLIVLRGFSKFFSAPGLRLGYGITSDLLCHSSITNQRHHWSINSLSAFAGQELLVDRNFIDESLTYIESERIRIAKKLSSFPDIHVFPNYANFFLVELTNPKHSSFSLFEYLIHKGLMIRDTSSFPFLHGHYFRFCILSQDENTLLLEAIHDYLL
ncbi:MAG: aminotransferase class I/II-fold pyridoxal phosphate-dependent enzyme [Vallitaleaceae bacterium]|nr:aminotransferase class I/II-fold pyridoxal phosphate-dependent enzyme [Vallitaleaceae bacterium]